MAYKEMDMTKQQRSINEHRVFLFDFDYTLANSSEGIVMCYQHVLHRHGFNEITEEAIKRTIGKTLEESFQIMTGIDDADILKGYRKEYVAEADKFMTVHTHLFPETKEVLETLKERGNQVGIISTKYRYRIEECVNQHFAKGFFDVIIGGEDVTASKPDPQGILAALNRLECERNEVLYVGDSTVDAETAERAGVDFVGVLNGVTTRSELEAFPHLKVVPNLMGLL
jgi:phosphoglycolate phosphatase